MLQKGMKNVIYFCVDNDSHNRLMLSLYHPAGCLRYDDTRFAIDNGIPTIVSSELGL